MPYLITILVLALLFLITTVIIVIMLAKAVSKPKRYETKETIEIEKRRNFYRDFDDYKKEEIEITCKDGYKLHGNYFENPQISNKYVIISHGFIYTRYGSIKYLFIFRRLGYNVLIYDNRSFGENEKNVCTMGIKESDDLLNVIDYMYDRFGDDIYLGLHGESMGASLSVMALFYKPKVKFLIADCGYADLYSVLIDQIKIQKHLPKFFIKPASVINKILYGYRFEDVEPIDSLVDNFVPICFIHGKCDTFTRPINSEKMYNVTKGYKELHLIESANHAQSLETNEGEYNKIVEDFLNKI